MPILLAGLSWLWTAIASLFPVLVVWFARWFTKKTLYMAAYYAAYLALTAGIFSTLEISITTLAPILPDAYHVAAGLMLPSNSYACLAAVLTAYAVRWVYDWQVKLLDISTRTWANL